MTISNFAEVHTLLARYVPQARSGRQAYTLERMQKLMDFLGNPQDQFKTIHVAGTSGKTSTAYYTAALLSAAGIKAGLMASPHVDEVNERVQIDLEPLAEKQYCAQFSIFMDLVESSKVEPTYFELLVAFGYWLFAREAVTYAVVEVGVGGLLDGTNVITRTDKLCVITDIGFDHTQILGRTLPAIISQKAGIIHSYNTVVMYEQAEEIMRVVREVAEREQAVLHEIWPLAPGELPKSLPLFQRRNWYLALSVYDTLSGRDGLPELNEQQLAKSASVYIPARMEIVRVGTKTVILDGAHNAQKVEALTQSIKAKYPKAKVAVVLSMLHAKHDKLQSSLQPLLAIADRIIITSFDTEYSPRKVSVNPLKLAATCDELGFEQWEIIDDPKRAYRALLECNEEVLLVTGSFFLLNHIRPIMILGPNAQQSS